MNTPEQFQLPSELVLELTQAQPRLFGFLLKRLGNRDQAQEILQEVNVVLCRKASTFELGTNFMAWAFSVARTEVLIFRQNQQRDRLVFSPDLREVLDQLDSELFPSEHDAERQQAVTHCLGQLSPSYQTLMLQHYAEAEAVKDIASRMGRTANAVSMILHRIRGRLMRCVESTLANGIAPK
jgi:RNA polymerase sigma-70 factor (ECF subfamily)